MDGCGKDWEIFNTRDEALSFIEEQKMLGHAAHNMKIISSASIEIKQ